MTEAERDEKSARAADAWVRRQKSPRFKKLQAEYRLKHKAELAINAKNRMSAIMADPDLHADFRAERNAQVAAAKAAA